MNFGIDLYALLIAIPLCLLAFRTLKRQPTEPSLSFSSLFELKNRFTSTRTRYSHLPDSLIYAALALFLVAFVNPHYSTARPKPEVPLPTEGIAIYLLLDQSGSMKEQVNIVTPSGQNTTLTKIELLKQMTRDFILERTNDLIGLVEFARVPRIVSPLTLDHSYILSQLSRFNAVQSNDEDGTAIGYAIYKTVSIIAATKHFAEDLLLKGRPAYTIKNSIIVVVTDGLQYPNPQDKGNRLRNIDLDEASAYAKDNGVKVYIVNVDPSVATNPELEPQRNQMKRITELTGGQLFLTTDKSNLAQIYATIDKLEKSKLPEETKREENTQYRQVSLYPLFLGCGLLCLTASILLRTTVLRRIP